ncbi:hypothetical protein HDU92_007271 [Lobulomyces angularis]|nr:hypothetical protein HDU92_007271 [Lobulomyces angularis]
MVDQLLQNQVDILKLIQYIKKKKGGNIKCNIKQITTKLRFSPSSSYYDVESEYDNLIYKLEVHNVSEYQIMKLKSCLAKLGNRHRNILQFLYLLQGNPLAVDIDDEETMESYSTTIENESSFTFNQPYTGDHWEKEIYYTSDSENEIEENNEHYVDIHSNSDEEDDSCLKNKKSFGLSKNGFSTLKTVKEFIHKLERNRYWDRKYNAHIDIGGAHAENKTYNTFEFCNPLSLNLNSKKIFVTELELIYDCLLFLNVAIMGYTEDFKTNKNKTFYLNEGNVYQVSMDLVLTHVSEKSLWNTLFEFSKFGNMFQRLNYFILRSMDISSCQTIKALGFSVREEILIYWKWLNRIFEFYKINRKDRREKFSTSLLELYELITLSLSSLKELDVFLVNLSFELEKQNSNSKISTTILNFLFEEITKQQFLRRLEERNISEDLHQDLLIFKINFTEKKSFVFLLFTLLKKTLIPYLKILGGWIKNGRLDDPFSEFFISRNREIESNNEQFDWNAKYFIKKEKDQNLLLIPKIFLNSYNEILSLGKTIKLVELIEKLVIANQETNFKFFVNEAEKEGFFENFNFFSAVEKFFDNFMNKNDFNVLDRKNFNQFCVHNDDLSSVNNIKGITTAIGNTRAIPFEIVLHANSIKFLNEVEKLNSLDEILLYHKKFLENLLISCCLTEKILKICVIVLNLKKKFLQNFFEHDKKNLNLDVEEEVKEEERKTNDINNLKFRHNYFFEDDKVNQNSVDEKFDFRKGSYYNKVLNKLRIEFITLKEFHLSMLIGLGSLGDEKFSQAAYYTDL